MRLIIVLLLMGCTQVPASDTTSELSLKQRGELRLILRHIEHDPEYLVDKDNRVAFMKWCTVTARMIDRDSLIHRFNGVCRENKQLPTG